LLKSVRLGVTTWTLPLVAPALRIMVFNVLILVSPLFSGAMFFHLRPALHLE